MSQRDRRSPEESEGAGRQAGAGAEERVFAPPPRGATRRSRPNPDPEEAPSPGRVGSGESGQLPPLGTERPDEGFGYRRIEQGGQIEHDPTDPAAWSDEGFGSSPTDAVWDEIEPGPVAAPPARPGRRRARQVPGRIDGGAEATHQRRPRSPGSSPWPALLGRLAIVGDRVALGLLGAGLLSLAAMAAVVASRAGGIEPIFPVHLNASGLPDRWAGPRILWRLPLLAGVTLATNLVLAWALSPLDRFAARFLLAAGLVIQLLVWVALLDLL